MIMTRITLSKETFSGTIYTVSGNTVTVNGLSGAAVEKIYRDLWHGKCFSVGSTWINAKTVTYFNLDQKVFIEAIEKDVKVYLDSERS